MNCPRPLDLYREDSAIAVALRLEAIASVVSFYSR